MREENRLMKMREIIRIASVMLILAAMTGTAFAEPYYLPKTGSTYGEENGWSGYKIFEDEEESINVMLTFNVYDMQTDNMSWVGDIDFGDDRYLYAYQLFNHNEATTDITSLNLVDLAGNPIAQFLMNWTQAIADPAHAEAVMPDPNPSTEQGKWTWSQGVGFVSKGKYSTFLIFSSDSSPVAGDFKVEVVPAGELPIPDVPEPASIVMLGGALAYIASRRTKKNRQA